MESIDLIPLDGDVAKITRRAEDFKDLHDALQRNLQTYLPLTMDALAAVHQKVKSSHFADANRQMVSFRRESHNILLMPTLLRISDFDITEKKIKVSDGLCRYPEVSDVTRCLFVLGKIGRRDCSLTFVKKLSHLP